MISKEERIKIKKHCLQHNLKYRNILKRINYQLTKKNNKEEKTLEELIEFATERYKYREVLNKIDYNLNRLKSANTNKEFREICINLKINWDHVLKLSYKGYDKKQAILYFWYFYDELKDDKKDLSRKRLLEINDEKKLINQDVYYLISFYKCGKKDYLEQIIDYEEIYLKRVTMSIAYKFGLSSIEREDLISEAKLILIEVIDKITLNNIKQIISYIRLVLYGRLIAYTNKNYRRVTEFNEEYMYKGEGLDECSMV